MCREDLATGTRVRHVVSGHEGVVAINKPSLKLGDQFEKSWVCVFADELGHLTERACYRGEIVAIDDPPPEDHSMEEFIDGQTVWIAGQAHIPPGESPDGLTPYPWSLQGVFATEDDAVAACKGKATWFIGPAIIGECLPDENVLWEGAYWPIGRNQQ